MRHILTVGLMWIVASLYSCHSVNETDEINSFVWENYYKDNCNKDIKPIWDTVLYNEVGLKVFRMKSIGANCYKTTVIKDRHGNKYLFGGITVCRALSESSMVRTLNKLLLSNKTDCSKLTCTVYEIIKHEFYTDEYITASELLAKKPLLHDIILQNIGEKQMNFKLYDNKLDSLVAQSDLLMLLSSDVVIGYKVVCNPQNGTTYLVSQCLDPYDPIFLDQK